MRYLLVMAHSAEGLAFSVGGQMLTTQPIHLPETFSLAEMVDKSACGQHLPAYKVSLQI